MGRAKETFGKKETTKKKIQKKQEKELRKEQRKENSSKGKTVEELFVYVDENGNLTSVPPELRKTKAPREFTVKGPVTDDPVIHSGVVSFFNAAKGYGFIKDDQTQESIFLHILQVKGTVEMEDRVEFQIENTAKGPSAVRVKKIQ
ncbi:MULTISPECIES: cold-shock protein [unclassified Siphonobacter]|uniref:cold-shock protein n=1 Tax=unclassified Siphonobacter TaxID=2635712 RepID=UPI000CC2C591|nr:MULTISPECIES: cold shock domain-containing protein [unclassified Siphonobacter]MDQ1089177.1 cold shock CspA family protein [Siphonobacter sp. SORGH_AS_1065]PKK34714.1 hypothetical protein BWI96_21055 [Siphonobacter sp. SORGH_AS_0500]